MQNTNQSKPDQRNSSHEKCLSDMVRRALENVNNFYAVKFLSACRSVKKPTKPNLIKKLLILKVSVSFSCRPKIGYNVVALGEGGEIEEQMFNLVQMFNRILMLKFSTKAPLLPNACWR
jgi:hypothetical protein